MADYTIIAFPPTNRITPKRAFIYSVFPEADDQHLVAKVYSNGSLPELGRFSSREAAIAFASKLPPSQVV
jgi:hypothetical protein